MEDSQIQITKEQQTVNSASKASIKPLTTQWTFIPPQKLKPIQRTKNNGTGPRYFYEPALTPYRPPTEKKVGTQPRKSPMYGQPASNEKQSSATKKMVHFQSSDRLEITTSPLKTLHDILKEQINDALYNTLIFPPETVNSSTMQKKLLEDIMEDTRTDSLKSEYLVRHPLEKVKLWEYFSK